MEKVCKRKEIGDYVFISKYARTVNGRKETWEESVDRVMAMHREKLGSLLDQPRLNELFEFATLMYKEKRVLGAQRALQFGGEPMVKHAARQFNCCGSYINRVEFYKELMYLLLCGCGCGYSVQKCHIQQLPECWGVDRSKKSRLINIDDSVEGWSLAVDALIKSYYYHEAPVHFDFSSIRKKGSFITGGFRAPGPEPLRKCLEKMDKLLQRWSGRKLTSFELHRLACIIADAVISGGVRRAALLCQFDADDQDMISCKTGEWWAEMPELSRANNSAAILPSTPEAVYNRLFKYIEEFGEPATIFIPHEDIVYNPCCFTGDTIVAVADGRNGVTIKELAEAGEKTPIYYKNKRGKVCIEYGRAFCTGEKKVVKVVLSNGSVINCTPDHPLRTVNGNYVAAGESEGVVLSKFFSSKKRKYRTINSFTNRYAPTYTSKEEPSLDYLAESVYVVSVVDEGIIEEVYDVEMDCPEHNFAIITKGDADYGNSEGVFVHNCEVAGYPQCEINGEKRYGFFFCNLTEINGAMVKTRQEFLEACEAAAILGTIQASWTNFSDILSPASKFIAERDSLIGVGITGMCENPQLLFDPELQREGAERVRQINKEVSRLIGINFAARCTVIKPSGNSSQMLNCTSSGISPFHFRRMIRNIQAANTEQALQVFSMYNPNAVERAAYDQENTSVVSFPVELNENVLVKEDLSAIEFLKLVKLTKENWIEAGTNLDHDFYITYPELKKVRMNVSNTCVVGKDEWDDVRKFVWENREVFSGISFLPEGGDLLYPQAPYTSVLDEKELADKYGAGAILAGGLIIDGLEAFDGDLWVACDAAMGRNSKVLKFSPEDVGEFIVTHMTEGTFLVDIRGVKVSDVNAIHSFLREKNDKRNDWVRRFRDFAIKYLEGDLKLTENCVKHVHLYHKWQNLKNIKSIDWNDCVKWEDHCVDVDTLAAQGCAGGACELKI
jgi:hypothetical protein